MSTWHRMLCQGCTAAKVALWGDSGIDSLLAQGDAFATRFAAGKPLPPSLSSRSRSWRSACGCLVALSSPIVSLPGIRKARGTRSADCRVSRPFFMPVSSPPGSVLRWPSAAEALAIALARRP
jgi:hypothetical protein